LLDNCFKALFWRDTKWEGKMADEEKRPLMGYLCHASGDKPLVRDLYNRLSAEGVDAWLDQEKLLPGQGWQMEIPRAVRNADAVVICLSKKSITKEGYVQKEINSRLISQMRNLTERSI
jgi:hypothetical protein